MSNILFGVIGVLYLISVIYLKSKNEREEVQTYRDLLCVIIMYLVAPIVALIIFLDDIQSHPFLWLNKEVPWRKRKK